MLEGAAFAVWGSAGHAKVLFDVIELCGGRVAVLFDNDPAATSCLPGVPLHIGTAGFRAWRMKADAGRASHAAVAIGGARGADRRALASDLRSAGLLLPVLIHPHASVSPSAHIGAGSQVLARTVVAADARIGEACIINNTASVDHECELGDGVHIAPGAVLCGCVSVGENTMVGAGAVVLPRIRIGRNAIVGAGAVVTRDVPERAVVVGNPARHYRKAE